MKCPSCGYDNPENALYCGMCQKAFTKPKTETPEPVHQSIATATMDVVHVEELNWFQRHLNITFLLPVFVVIMTGLVIGVTGYEKIKNDVISQFMLVLDYIAIFILGAWYVYRKNRSFGWLALLFLPVIAWVIFLCLENHRHEIRYPGYRPFQSASLTPGSRYG